MYHHDARSYRVAVDETAQRFQRELDATIQRNRGSALSVIERVQRQIPEDHLVSTSAMSFAAKHERIVLRAAGRDGFEMPLHRHALAQVADVAGVPDLFVSRMLEKDYGPALLAETLTTIFNREPSRRRLVRAIDGQVRGFLSDSFRRIDDRPVINSFASACAKIALEPLEGVGGELRFCLRAVLPRVFRPAGEEVLAFGIEISNSSFGCGALSIRIFVLRVWCTNYARMEEELRQIHLGKRLDDNLALSQRTHELDARTLASATKDVVLGALAPGRVNALVKRIEGAMTQNIDVKQALNGLPKLGLLKREVEAVNDVLLDGGVEKLPPGNNVYRLANAIGWIAKSAQTAERRLDLERLAGHLLLGESGRRALVAA